MQNSSQRARKHFCVAMFGMGLFCGLTIHGDSIAHNIVITIFGMLVFYITDVAVNKMGTVKHTSR